MRTEVDLTALLEDRALPFVLTALDTSGISTRLGYEVTSAEVIRYKPGKRVLIRYQSSRGPLLGKLRAGHRPATQFKLAQELRRAGFTEHAADGISVPQPVAAIDDLSMWVQRWVPGSSMTAALCVADPGASRALGARASAAARKVHRTNVASRRRHSVTDELGILHDRLGRVALDNPHWRPSIGRILRGCDTLALLVTDRPRCGIHRDFYPDQLLVDGSAVVLVDFDLYCEGDPALDIGNFAAHVIELGVRHHMAASAHAAVTEAVGSYLAAGGSGAPRADDARAIEVYTTLSLARHVALSRTLPDRSHTTGLLIGLVEERLNLNSGT